MRIRYPNSRLEHTTHDLRVDDLFGVKVGRTVSRLETAQPVDRTVSALSDVRPRSMRTPETTKRQHASRKP